MLSIQWGGTTYVADFCDPFIRGIISYALGAINWRSNSFYRQRVVRVLEVQRQVCFLLICIIAVVYCIVYYSKIPSIQYTSYLALEADISQKGISDVHYIQCAY